MLAMYYKSQKGLDGLDGLFLVTLLCSRAASSERQGDPVTSGRKSRSTGNDAVW